MAQDVAARAEAIRIARARLRLTQGELAARAGLDQSTVSKAEDGRASQATYDGLDQAIAALEMAGERS